MITITAIAIYVACIIFTTKFIYHMDYEHNDVKWSKKHRLYVLCAPAFITIMTTLLTIGITAALIITIFVTIKESSKWLITGNRPNIATNTTNYIIKIDDAITNTFNKFFKKNAKNKTLNTQEEEN